MKQRTNLSALIVCMHYIAASIGLAAISRQLPDGFSVFGIGPYIAEGNLSDYLTVNPV